MPIVKLSKKAEEDLLAIGTYTEQTWGLKQRNRYLDDINSRFQQLAENPNYPTTKDISYITAGCFSSLVNEHIIIYRKFNYGVRIIRVLSQSMDIQRHL